MPAPGGHPASFAKKIWIPAFGGMTGLQENSQTLELIKIGKLIKWISKRERLKQTLCSISSSFFGKVKRLIGLTNQII